MTAPQPDPREGRQSVTDAVVADLHERRDGGIKKYGGELKNGNGREALVDLYQELTDAVLYLRQELMEDEDREEAKVELEKAKVTLFRFRDVIQPGWVFDDLMRQIDFVRVRL